MSKKVKSEEYSWGDFLRDYKDPIGKILEGFASGITEAPRRKFHSLVSVFFMLGVIVAALVALSFFGKVSGDTVAFLFGSIVGYLFAFLQRYVVGIT